MTMTLPVNPAVYQTQPIVAAGWYPDQAGVQRYWDGQGWTQHIAPPVQIAVVQAYPHSIVTSSPVRTSHVFHLIMTFLTAGLWAPFVWLPITIINSARRTRSYTQIR